MICILSFITQAQAFEFKIEPDISISENYVSEENLYLVGLRSWFNTTHQKDIVSIALTQTSGGTVFGDALLIGNEVHVEGEYLDDVRVIANTVYVSGVINRDLVIAARNIIVEPRAIINGDSLMLANYIDVAGQLIGQSQITGNMVNVHASIIGQSTITGQKISFLKDTKTISDISYFSPQRAFVEEGAQIEKPLNYNQIESIGQNEIIKRIFFAFVSFWAIIKLVATLFMIFILTQLFRVFSQRIIDIVLYKKAYIILIGIASIIGIPLLILVLLASLVLIPIAFILSFIFGIMIILLPAISAIIIATLYQKYILKKEKLVTDFYTSALALIVLTFIGFIPFVGSWIVYVLYFASFGAMGLYLYEQVRRKKIV
jgi:hypothetical protein